MNDMMVDTLFRALNPWWESAIPTDSIPRPGYIDEIGRALDQGKIPLVHGLRRVGKTTILKQFIDRSLDDLGQKRVCFLSLDQPALQEMSLSRLLDTFRSICDIRSSEPHLLVLDEVQNRSGFEIELKGLYDIDDGLSIVVSGSSSLVIRQKSAAMTGRGRPIHVSPLTFQDYLRFTGRTYTRSEPPSMINALDEYLMRGGMPEYVLHRDPQTVVDLLDDIIFKDISSVYSIRDPLLLRSMFRGLMERVGRPLSYSKMGRIISLGQDAARRYVGYFDETYLVSILEKHGTPNERTYGPKKVYCPDNGICVVTVGHASPGQLAENLVHSLLRSRERMGFLDAHGKEVDFITSDMAIEVKFKDRIDDSDLDTLSTLKLRGVDQKVMVTRSVHSSRKDVRLIPLWLLAAEGPEGALGAR